MQYAEWIAVDWGTTHLRAWAMQGRSAIASAHSAKGMNALSPTQFEPALMELISDWLAPNGATQVMCCGMVGSRQGWAEATYVPVPCDPSGIRMVQPATQDPRIAVHILPGLSQKSPPDVMRGEETQIAGFLGLNAGWDGVICLPGTHSKWAHVSAGEVVSFQTFMTGELFALLEKNSVLRHSVQSDDWDEAVFGAALEASLAKPETLAARLFRIRASHLLEDAAPGVLKAELSGLLIGAELAAARPYWLGQNVAVIGADALAAAYVRALDTLAVPATHAKADAMTLAGLCEAHRALETT